MTTHPDNPKFDRGYWVIDCAHPDCPARTVLKTRDHGESMVTWHDAKGDCHVGYFGDDLSEEGSMTAEPVSPHDVTITILSTSGGAPTYVTRRAVPLAPGDVVLMSGLAAPVAFMGYPPKGYRWETASEMHERLGPQ